MSMATARWSLQCFCHGLLRKTFAETPIAFLQKLYESGSPDWAFAFVFRRSLVGASAKTFAETPTGSLQKLHESGSPDWCDGFGPVVIAV